MGMFINTRKLWVRLPPKNDENVQVSDTTMLIKAQPFEYKKRY